MLYPKSECPSPSREIQTKPKQKYYTRKSSVTGILESVEQPPQTINTITHTGQSGVTSRQTSGARVASNHHHPHTVKQVPVKAGNLVLQPSTGFKQGVDVQSFSSRGNSKEYVVQYDQPAHHQFATAQSKQGSKGHSPNLSFGVN